MTDMNYDLKVLLIASAAGVLLGYIVCILLRPDPQEESCCEDEEETESSYFEKVYNTKAHDLGDVTSAHKSGELAFFWDNLPGSTKDRFEIGTNTSLEWPPEKGTRTRVAAFPYTNSLRKNQFFRNFFRSVKLLLNNTYDSATFPGWIVSVYERDFPNENVYGKRLSSQFPWNDDGFMGDPYIVNSRIFSEGDVGKKVIFETDTSSVTASPLLKIKVFAKNGTSFTFEANEKTIADRFVVALNILWCTNLSGDQSSPPLNIRAGVSYIIKSVTRDETAATEFPPFSRLTLQEERAAEGGVEEGETITVLNPIQEFTPWTTSLSSDIQDVLLPTPEGGLYLEVTHACYAPPDAEYPLCDDGGYWLYMMPGTGVFWRSGQRVLLANNKIDAALKLLNTPKVKAYIFMTEGKQYDHGIDYLCDKFKDAEGKQNIVVAITDVVKKVKKSGNRDNNKTSLLLAAFRRMDHCSSAIVTWTIWFVFLFFTISLCGGMLACALRKIALAMRQRRDQDTKSAIFLICLYLVVGTCLVLTFWYVITDLMIQGFGWITLSSGLKETKFGLKQFIIASAGQIRRSKNETEEMKKAFLIANGFAITQVLDVELEVWTAILGLDGFILHTQPNKGGIWTVEMCDIRNFRQKLMTEKGEDGVFVKLGICGQTGVDIGRENAIPPPVECGSDFVPSAVTDPNTNFASGPLKQSLKGGGETQGFLSYIPCGSCNCDEAKTASDLQKDSTHLTKCLNCGYKEDGQPSQSLHFCSPW